MTVWALSMLPGTGADTAAAISTGARLGSRALSATPTCAGWSWPSSVSIRPSGRP